MKTNYLGLIKTLDYLAAQGHITAQQTLSVAAFNYKPHIKIGNFSIKTDAGKFIIREWNKEQKHFVHILTAWVTPAGNLEVQSELGLED